jgi:myo-inositol-1(or 4)-monophosphatase
MALSPNMNVMLRAIEKTARSLTRDFGEVEQLQVSRKGPGDFVSAADRRAEEILYEELSKARPDYAFLMEESGAKGPKDADYRWIIDPLDGTNNFLHGIPHWCISVALEFKGEIVVGVVYDPIKDEMFRAQKGEGAFVRNKRLRVSGRTNLESCMIGMGQPAQANSEERAQFSKESQAVLNYTQGLRRYGAAALDLAYVAAGRLDAFWENGLKSWDMAAGYIIVREAGGVATQMDGRSEPVFAKNILAGNDTIHGELKTILNGVRRKKDAA